MPVTTRYSAALEQPYCESGPASPMERRNSNSTDSLDDRSNSSSGSHSRQISQEGSAEFIPTRVTKVTSPKPASNPMQFVKIQPCHLYKSAQEQLKKVEEVKKVQEKTKDEAEEWQSNLDNWKSSRRKRQESIIERVTEVKKLEEEEAYLRARRKSKTFNEMMEERYSRGRKVSLPIYLDDDGNDLSDLGIGTSSGKSSISEDYHSTSEDNNTEYDNHHEAQNGKKENGENGVNGHDSSSEEYTYERAIQSYVNYAEAHVKSKLRTSDSDSKDKANSVLSNGHSKRRASEPCRVSVKRGSKIEERLSAFEHHAEKSVQRSGVKVQSVDVLKRRELFERSGTDSKDVKPPKHIAHKSNSSRDQLSSSENEDSPVENNKPMNGNSGESINQNFDNRFTNGFDGSSISSTDDMYESRQTPRSLDSLEVESQASSLTTNDDSQLSRSDGFERDQSIDNLDATQNLPSDKCSHTVDDLLGLHDDIEQVHGSSMLEPLKSPSASENEMKISNCTSHREGDDQIIDLEIQVVNQDESARKEVSTAFVDVAQALSMPQEETSCTREEVLPATKPEENHVPKKETPVKMMPLAQLDSLEAEIIPLESKVSEVQSETLTQQHNAEVSSQPAMGGGVQCAVEELIVQTSSNDVPQEKRSEEVMEAQLQDDSVFLDNPPETKGLPQLNASVQDKNNDIILGINSDLIPNIPLTTDVGFVPGLAFPLDLPTTTTAEPPKEKPPPPPVDLEDDVPECSVKRMESTKRLKKEIRRKRSDFLGIEDHSDDSYLEQQLSVAPPPDMATLLQEERRLEQQMYQQVFSETDSNQGETTESRDSGVELDRNHGDELWNTANIADNNATHVNDEELSKAFQNSANIAEDIIMKKEREILDIMEQEQQWKYNNNVNAEDNVIGERLAEKLKQLEEEKIQLEKERAEEERRKQEEEDARRMEQMRLREREEQLRQQETVVGSPSKLYPGNREDEVTPGEALYMEKERLQKEQEELQRQRETLERVQQQQQLQQHQQQLQQQQLQHQQFQQQQEYQQQANDIQAMNGSSRMPSADSIPQQVRDEPHHMGSVPQLGQQMSRQTLHALSATPRSRLIPTDTWIAKKKNEGQRRENFNYQHWLIQEAEHRRIMEQQQRQAHYRSPQPLSQKQLQCWTTTSQPPVQPPRQPGDDKPLPDAIIQTLTQRVQNRVGYQDQKARARKRYDVSPSPREGSEPRSKPQVSPPGHNQPISSGHNRISPSAPHVGHGQPLMHGPSPTGDQHEKMLSVSGKKKCSHCGEELGRGAAMIIESLRLFYHIDCFKCCVCHVQLGDGLNGTDVRVRNNKLHCHNCYSNDDGLKFSCV